MSPLQDKHPPNYAECTKDHLLDSFLYVPTQTDPENDATAHSPVTAPEPEALRHIWGERRQRLKKKLAKGLKVGAGAAALTVAIPVVLTGQVVYKGGKVVLQIVAAPFVLCVICLCMDDFDF